VFGLSLQAPPELIGSAVEEFALPRALHVRVEFFDSCYSPWRGGCCGTNTFATGEKLVLGTPTPKNQISLGLPLPKLGKGWPNDLAQGRVTVCCSRLRTPAILREPCLPM